jgi:lipid-A-disaccharide synthase
MAGHVLGWLNNPRERDAAVAKLTALRNRVAVPGACDRAADFLLGDLGSLRHAA